MINVKVHVSFGEGAAPFVHDIGQGEEGGFGIPILAVQEDSEWARERLLRDVGRRVERRRVGSSVGI